MFNADHHMDIWYTKLIALNSANYFSGQILHLFKTNMIVFRTTVDDSQITSLTLKDRTPLLLLFYLR